MNRDRRSRPAVWVILLATALFATACSSASEGSSGTSISIVLTGEPTALESCDSPLTGVGVVLRSNVTQSLTLINANTGEVEPQLATAWEQVDDRTWNFSLRDDVTFQDGEAFNADAAAFGIERAVDPELGCNVVSEVFGEQTVTVKAVDEYTVQVQTSEPSPILPKAMAYLDLPSPETPRDARQTTSVGTGPYTVESVSNESIVLKRWDDFWGDLPEVEEATYTWLTEPSARSALAKTADATIVFGMLPSDTGVDGVEQFDTTDTLLYRLSTNIDPLGDVRLREAINLAVDREGIIKSAMGGLGTPASQITGSYNEGYNPDLEVYPYDPARAKELVEEARADGVRVDTPITLYERAGQFPGLPAVDQAIQAQLAEIGLEVEIEVVNPEVAIDISLTPRDLSRPPNMAQNVHGNASGDAWITLSTKYLSSGRSSTLEAGTSLDQAILRGSTETGEPRVEAFQEAFKIAHDEVFPELVMFHFASLIYVNPDVTYEPNPNTPNLLNISTIEVN